MVAMSDECLAALAHALGRRADADRLTARAAEQRAKISAHLRRHPHQLDQGDLAPQRRKRYFWASWGVSSSKRQLRVQAALRASPSAPARAPH